MNTLLDKLEDFDEEDKKYIRPLDVDEEKPEYSKLETWIDTDYNYIYKPFCKWDGITYEKKIKRLDEKDITDLGFQFLSGLNSCDFNYKRQLLYKINKSNGLSVLLYFENMADGSIIIEEQLTQRQKEFGDSTIKNIIFKGKLRHKLDLKRLMIQLGIISERTLIALYELDLNK
jgi:hypothetical protein